MVSSNVLLTTQTSNNQCSLGITSGTISPRDTQYLLPKLDRFVSSRLFKLKRTCNEYKRHYSGERHEANHEEDISASSLFHQLCIDQKSGLSRWFEIAILQ